MCWGRDANAGRVQGSVGGGMGIDSLIRSWRGGEIAAWKDRRLRHEDALSEYHDYNETRRRIFLFELERGCVTIADKPAFYSREELDHTSRDTNVTRARRYRKFLEYTCSTRCADIRATIAFDVSDMGLSSNTAPIFVFQKSNGSNSLLFPDIDFINHDFYQSNRVARLHY